ncbi:MAG: tetraacyldisaccharide 4'-kinase [Chromatiales bacterium]|nr:tetraacyldisaccharide 4'-kinase [Gammaproteobacteria bacterium]MBW6477232.1 tetraacyldisaccharide 4'-kinase [Chromatiales bacterium]
MIDLAAHWYRASPWLWLLWPLSLLFCALVWLRRLAYRRGWLASHRLPVPLIVIGNITAGGSGKTPLVLYLAEQLKQRGYRPGLISRGYGGQSIQWPQPVRADSVPQLVGDEALLLVQRSGCPMMVGPDRVAAAEALLAGQQVDIILADDGLQHYRLGRDIEIAVLDGQRRLGNRLCLPAGPLREPPGRLNAVDFVVANGEARAGEWAMQLQGSTLCALKGNEQLRLAALAGQRVHAVAGIGHPQRFFASLRAAGLELIEHPFGDHHPYGLGELDFADGLPVLMTEKDAVKYRLYAGAQHWYLPVQAQLDEEFMQQLLSRLPERATMPEKNHGQETA